ncbi:hypothetical protein Tco_0715715 [Tanacetum coccineum]
MKVGLKVRSVVMRKKCKWDKDIVKGAFKTFQNRVNQLPSSDRTSTRPKQERKDAEMKKLRQKLTFKAKPMPSFYRTQGASKTTSQKIQMGESRKENASEVETFKRDHVNIMRINQVADDLTDERLQDVTRKSLEVVVEEPAVRQALSNLIEGALLLTNVGGMVEIVSTLDPTTCGALIIIDDDRPDMHYMVS